MKISKSTIYIVFILVIQYLFIIAIPIILFNIYNSVVFFSGSVLFDQLVKAIISFLSVAFWIYQWMWLTNRIYRSLTGGR